VKIWSLLHATHISVQLGCIFATEPACASDTAGHIGPTRLLRRIRTRILLARFHTYCLYGEDTKSDTRYRLEC